MTSLLGGLWTATHVGVPFDAVKAYASGSRAQAWAKRYFGVQQASFSLKRYGDKAASQLAQYWCSRMEYFYQIYLQEGGEGFTYSEEHTEAAPSPEGSGCMFGDPLAAAPARSRLEQLQCMTPGGPAASSSGA